MALRLPEKGELDADAFLAAGAPVRVTGLSLHSVLAPNDALATIATRLAALAGTWDDATYEELLFPTFDRAEMKQFFGGLARDAGTCTVDRTTNSDGETRAKWRLACTKRALDLEVTMDPKNGRVGEMVITGAKGGEGRCPR